MNRGCCLLGVVVLCLVAVTSDAQEAKDLDAKVTEAWKKAGARYAWAWYDSSGRLEVAETRPKNLDAVPTLFCPMLKAKAIADLPDPGQPFGISLTESGIADEEVKELARFKKLRLLQLPDRNVFKEDEVATDEGLKAVAGLTELRALDLNYCRVTDAGMKTVARFSQLRHFSYWGIDVKEDGWKELIALKHLRTLAVGPAFRDSDLEHVTQIATLESLILAAARVTDLELARLGKLKKLRSLNLGYTQVSDAGLKHVVALKDLEQLWLHGTRITDKGAKVLVALTNLRVLNVQATVITDIGFRELASMKSLRHLDVVGVRKVTKATLAESRKARPDLKIVGQ